MTECGRAFLNNQEFHYVTYWKRLHYCFKASRTLLRPEAAIKRSVEYDCYIYAWNSACTVEGVDITMVWNTLLLVCLGV